MMRPFTSPESSRCYAEWMANLVISAEKGICLYISTLNVNVSEKNMVTRIDKSHQLSVYEAVPQMTGIAQCRLCHSQNRIQTKT
jgi:hypothetical protein